MSLQTGQLQKIRNSLRFSVLDGSAWAAMFGLTQNYISPFALALKATTTQIGLLTSIPSLVMAMSQLFAPALEKKAGSRKALLLPAVSLHALLWAPVFLVPFLVPEGKVWWLIGLVAASTAFGAIANPAWGSMMADLVPDRIRGRYFSSRSRVINLVALAFSFAGGGILQLLRFFDLNIFIGFAILFGAAVIFRLVSFYFLVRMYEPPSPSASRTRGGIALLFKDTLSSNIGKFSIFVAAMSFCVNLSGPFFSVYMLRDLNFSYLSFVIVNSAGSLATILFVTYWGRRADRAGNVRIIRIACCLIPLVPILWLFSTQVWYLVLVQTFASFAWAGFDLANVNFVYDASPPEERTRRIAIFNTMNGIAIFLGALTGGALATRLPPLFGYSLLTLFALSGVLRAIVGAVLLRRVREVRHVTRVGLANLLFTRPRNNHHHRAEGRLGRAHYRRHGMQT
jgi:MFS family permease